MKKMIFIMAATGLVVASCGTKEPAKTAGINYDYMDTTARPGDDFRRLVHRCRIKPRVGVIHETAQIDVDLHGFVVN